MVCARACATCAVGPLGGMDCGAPRLHLWPASAPRVVVVLAVLAVVVLVVVMDGGLDEMDNDRHAGTIAPTCLPFRIHGIRCCCSVAHRAVHVAPWRRVRAPAGAQRVWMAMDDAVQKKKKKKQVASRRTAWVRRGIG